MFCVYAKEELLGAKTKCDGMVRTSDDEQKKLYVNIYIGSTYNESKRAQYSRDPRRMKTSLTSRKLKYILIFKIYIYSCLKMSVGT